MEDLVAGGPDHRGWLSLRGRSPAERVGVALGTYVAWTLLTWLLEGRMGTLLRPEATLDRLVYTGIANLLMGTLLALWIVRTFVADGATTRDRLGFRPVARTLLAVLVAGALGVSLYLAQGAPSLDAVVVANAFAQVLPVSIAEILVCWVLVGGTIEAGLAERGVGRNVAGAAALVVSAVLFGVYHLAHSPPFDTPRMVGVLTVVGIVTGLVYYGGRSAYGVLVLHAWLALFGVTSALAAAGQLVALRSPQVPLLLTALVALAVLVVGERRFVRG